MNRNRFSPLFVLSLFLAVFLNGQIAEPRYFVRSVSFEGNESFRDGRLGQIIKQRPSRFLRGSEFNRRSLKLDVITLRNFYRSEGFLDVTVEESFRTDDKRRVDIHFTIDEGKQYFLRSVSISGNVQLQENWIRKSLRLSIGKPFNPVKVQQGLSKLESEYRRIGKLFPVIHNQISTDDDVDFSLTIEEGPTVRVDQVMLDGLKHADSSIVLRELRFEPESVYNEDLIELSQRQIFETGLFSLVNIVPLKSQRGESWVNVHVEVRELKSRELLSEGGFYPIRVAGEGVQPKQGVGITLGWANRNIFRSGTRFGIKGTLEVPIEETSIDLPYQIPWVWRLELSLSRQWIGGLRLPTSVRLFWEKISELAFEIEDFPLEWYGIDWDYVRKFSEQSTLRGGLRWMNVDTVAVESARKGPDSGQGTQEKSFRIAYRYRDLDDPIAPTRGVFFSAQLSLVGTFLGGDYHYYRQEFDYRRYFSTRASWVVALRSNLGWMAPLGQERDEIPPYHRFYLGGSTSLRAWDSGTFPTETNIDQTGAGEGRGGLVKFLMNAEVRIPISKRFGVDFFIDSGILAESATGFRAQAEQWLKGVGWNYGIEPTWTTPLGPIRVYYAVRLKQPNRARFGLGVSYAF